MKVRILIPLIMGAGLLVAVPRSFALSAPEAQAIAEKVIALNDPEATKAFNALNEKGVFKVTETSGDPAKEIAFRVLEIGDPALNQSFNYLKGKGVFEAPASGLTEPDRLAMRDVMLSLSQCKGELDRINPLVEEYNRSWIPGRLRIRKQIAVTIEQARAYLQRAQSRFHGYMTRTEAEIKAVATEVERTRKEFNDYIEWWNREFVRE